MLGQSKIIYDVYYKSQFVTYTNASSVYDLAGSGYQIGGSASIPVLPPMCATGGADLVTFPAPNGKDYYAGVSLSAGVGLGAGYEGQIGRASCRERV